MGKAASSDRSTERGVGTNARRDRRGDARHERFCVETVSYLATGSQCFCFDVIFCAKGAAGVRGQAVNTVDKLRAKKI